MFTTKVFDKKNQLQKKRNIPDKCLAGQAWKSDLYGPFQFIPQPLKYLFKKIYILKLVLNVFMVETGTTNLMY